MRRHTVILGLAAALALTIAPAVAVATEVNPAPASQAWTVDGRGNGHGHGLSQYGARGAALAGLTAPKIVAFYYPGTQLVTTPASTIRVWITDAGSATTVQATPDLRLAGVGALTTPGVSRWRLVPSGAGLAVQRLASGHWTTTRSGLPSGAEFTSTTGVVRTYHGDGSSTDYRGAISAVRSGSGAITVNRLSLDDYVRGVVPREMPASWPSAAVQAQAIAARTYAKYVAEHGGGGSYDICDTTNCQVYGGKAVYDSAGNLLYGEDTRSDAAVAQTARQVLYYGGHAAFAQFAASNGGVMAAGGQPYLVSKVDPYDNARSGDPYLGWSRAVSVARVADYYGLAHVASVDITARVGGGPWGGVVTAATVRGTDSSGRSSAVQVSGSSLASAMGLPYSLFHIRASAPVGQVEAVAVESLRTYRVSGWTFDPQHTDVSTRVHVYVDSGGHAATADLAATTVQRTYQTASAAHGFSIVVPVPMTGTHRLCVYGLDAANVHHTTLMCRTLTPLVNPFGHVETASLSGSSYRTRGWAFDPDLLGGPAQMRLSVDGVARTYPAATPRRDVAAHYGLRDARVGFDVTVALTPGTHRVCTSGANQKGAGRDTSFGCTLVHR
jgi:peptidoglycan hydrolase-like amidase